MSPTTSPRRSIRILAFAVLCIGLPLVPASASRADPYGDAVLATPGVTSFWRLAETSGTVAHDVVSGRNGTYVGGPVHGAGDIKVGVGLDGVDDRVTVPVIGDATDFTVEGFEHIAAAPGPSPANGNHALYGQYGSVRLLPRPSGIYAGVWLGGVEYKIQASTRNNTRRWVHWALVRTGPSLLLYRNGALVGSRSDLPAAAAAHLAGDIGHQGGYFARGILGDVAIYLAALSADQVRSHFVAWPQHPPWPAGFLAEWLLNETVAGQPAPTVAYDYIGDNDGVYVGDLTPGNFEACMDGDDYVRLPSLGQVEDFTIEGGQSLPVDAPNGRNETLYGRSGTVRLLPRGDGFYAGLWVRGVEYALQGKVPLSEPNAGRRRVWTLVRSGGTLSLYRDGVLLADRSDVPTGLVRIDGEIGRQGGTAYGVIGCVGPVTVSQHARPPQAG